ncbi:MAG: hypothetical protein LBJ76_07055 [Candidatus Accumulibacter sp.]|nr:hypothetical protein [Accumulibacter sp.]
MKFTKNDLPRLRAALLVSVTLTALGGLGVYLAMRSSDTARRTRGAARVERDEFDRKLRQVRNEENEIKEKAAIYARIEARGILSEVKRLEWIELIDAIREKERLIDFEYEIDPQRALSIAPNDEFSFVASSMKMRVRLLHEEDLTRLIDQLRQRAPALIEVRSCNVSRLTRVDDIGKSAARLLADCRIDWVTLRKTRADETGKRN